MGGFYNVRFLCVFRSAAEADLGTGMVMEDAPTPQSVGREFVRQYYTLLNSAPTHLHRQDPHLSYYLLRELTHLLAILLSKSNVLLSRS